MTDQSDFDGTIYIHIGPHKTGTTTIQQFFSDNQLSFSSRGLLYPTSGRGGEAPEQHWLFGEAVLKYDTKFLGQFAAGVDQEIKLSGARKLLISTEVLSRKYATSEHLSLIRSYFPHAKCIWIFLLRRQDKLLASLYSEQIKKGLIRFPKNEILISGPEFLDHLRRLQIVAEATKSDAIKIASFELMKDNLIYNFLQLIEESENIEPYLLKNDLKNVALSNNALQIIRIINAFPYRISQPIRKKFLQILKTRRISFGAQPVVTKIPSHLLAQYQSSNKAIQIAFFEGIDQKLSIPGGDKTPSIFPEIDDKLKQRVKGWIPNRP